MSDQLFLNGKKYLATRHASSFSDYSHDYLMRLCREGKLQAEKINGRWYVEEILFNRFLRDHKLELQAKQEQLSKSRQQEYYTQQGRGSWFSLNDPFVNVSLGNLVGVPVAFAALLFFFSTVFAMVAWNATGSGQTGQALAGVDVFQGASLGYMLSGLMSGP